MFASFIFRDYGENFQRIFTKDGSNRIDFAITGLQAILEYPAGISDENYLYIKQLNSVSFNNVGVLLLESHNGFVNAALQYTMFGAIGFFIYIRLLFNKLIKSNQIKYFMFIVTAYSIHIFHHNQVLFVNDFFNTIILVIVGLEINNQKSK